MKTKILIGIAAALVCWTSAQAQSTFAVTGGYGMATARFYPKQEMKALWGAYSGGLSWRYYAAPRFVGCVGVDVEWMQRGYSFAPNASSYTDKTLYKYYTRHLNTIMVPIVWQPHFYMIHNHVRVYLEAAVTFSYNFKSTFDNEETGTSGDYMFRRVRDNHFNYGLAGGGGIDFLIGRFEIGARARYYFGYSDILRNRNKYYNNAVDDLRTPGENPFYYSPQRSPLDNIALSIKLGWRFGGGKDGFKEWSMKKKPKVKSKEVFKYEL